MLTRDRLTDDQWTSVRNAPHHVIIAVSAAGGSAFDEMLERAAGLQGIVDGMHSTHPLLREIAVSDQILRAQDQVRAWYYTLEDGQRTPSSLQAKALNSLGQALEVLGSHGGHADVLHYSDFVLALAMRVARAAKEGDLLGVGGKLVSDAERAFIERIELVVQQRRTS